MYTSREETFFNFRVFHVEFLRLSRAGVF